jgi:recombinational DNA repair protein (RecF pathway)
MVRMITESQGFLKVFLKKENYTKNLQVGSLIIYRIEQKNKDSIMFISFEVIKNFINSVYFDRRNLYYFNSMRFVLNRFFVYNENMNGIYKSFKGIMFSFENGNRQLAYDYINFLLSVVAFWGVCVIKYDDGNFYDESGRVIHIPRAFLTFDMDENSLRQLVQSVSAAMRDIQ